MEMLDAVHGINMHIDVMCHSKTDSGPKTDCLDGNGESCLNISDFWEVKIDDPKCIFSSFFVFFVFWC